MFDKKKIDISDIVKESVREAMKTHGLVREQEEIEKQPEAFEEKFDVEKHLSYLQIKPKQFGRKGTFEAADVDAVISSLIGEESPGLNRFKKCLVELNRSLGKTPGEFGIPSGLDNDSKASAKTIFSALQLNYLIGSIINKQDARVAGKMFEGLVARMLGANSSNEDDSIEDMVIDGGQYVSLKTLDPTVSEFKGSKFNLAKAIAFKESVTYLVCEKDKKNDPFSFKAYSFTVDRNNYFNIISNRGRDKSIVNIDELNTIIDSISQTTIKKIGESKLSNNLNLLNEAKSDQEIFDNALKKFAVETLGASLDNQEDLIIKVRNYLKQIIDQVFQSETYKQLSRNETFYKEILSNIDAVKDSIPQSLGKKILNRNTFEVAYKQVKDLYNILLSDTQLDRYFGKKITSPTTESFRRLLESLKPLLAFFEKLEAYYKEEDAQTHQANIEAGKTYASRIKSTKDSITDRIEEFFAEIRVGKRDRKPGSTQFEIDGNAIKALAVSLGANYDDSYERFIVSSGFIMTNAANNAETLKKWIEPIYREFYKIDQGLKKFFVKDETNGLSVASGATETLKAEINKVPKSPSGEFAKASELRENNKNPLTKHWTEIMLEELTK